MARTSAAKRPARAAAVLSIQIPELAKGEAYAGFILEKGVPTHHVVLLPGELERGTWKEAAAWAKKQGGELPSRREGALLFANAHEAFQPRWYWLGEQPAGDEGCAWCQGFSTGNQYWTHVSSYCRARAVRRVPIQ